MISKILEHDTYAYGFDAQTGEFGNLVTKGIIDPHEGNRRASQIHRIATLIGGP